MIVAEEAFDCTLATTGERLAGLAAAALAEHRAGETIELELEFLTGHRRFGHTV